MRAPRLDDVVELERLLLEGGRETLEGGQEIVRDLTELNESPLPEQWSVDDAPADYLEKMLHGIVGVELRVDSLVGKRKLSQNRPAEDQAGIVAGLAQPGGNVTGISGLQTELVAKRLQFLKTLAPGVRRVWLIYDGGDLGTTSMIGRALEAAPPMKLEIVPRGVLDTGALKRVLGEMRRGDGVLAPEGSSLDIPLAILERSLTMGAPAIFASALWVGHGGLVSYGPDSYAEGLQAAALVAKILRGSHPRDLPVEGAERIDLAVNLKTAELLALTVPRKILLRADAFRR